jgi:hypothetical protein
MSIFLSININFSKSKGRIVLEKLLEEQGMGCLRLQGGSVRLASATGGDNNVLCRALIPNFTSPLTNAFTPDQLPHFELDMSSRAE